MNKNQEKSENLKNSCKYFLSSTQHFNTAGNFRPPNRNRVNSVKYRETYVAYIRSIFLLLAYSYISLLKTKDVRSCHVDKHAASY